MNTLVLDMSYQPVNRTSWRRALALLAKGRAEVVHYHESGAAICSITMEFKVPAVVRLLQAITGHKGRVKFSRQNVWARDRGTCQYCRAKVSKDDFTYEHVIPRTQGGKTEWSNVVVACSPCNQKKGGRTPQQAGMQLLTTPTRPKSMVGTVRLTLTWQKGMPPSWRDFLASYQYWNGELEA